MGPKQACRHRHWPRNTSRVSLRHGRYRLNRSRGRAAGHKLKILFPALSDTDSDAVPGGLTEDVSRVRVRCGGATRASRSLWSAKIGIPASPGRVKTGQARVSDARLGIFFVDALGLPKARGPSLDLPPVATLDWFSNIEPLV